MDGQRSLVACILYSITVTVYANEFCAYNVTSVRSDQTVHVSWSKLNDACKEPFYVRFRLNKMSHKDFRISRNGPNFIDVKVDATWSKVYIVCHGGNCHLNYQSENAAKISEVTGMKTASELVLLTAMPRPPLKISSVTTQTTLILSAATPNATAVYHTETDEGGNLSTVTDQNVAQDEGSLLIMITILPGCVLLLTCVVFFLKRRRKKRSDELKLVNEEANRYKEQACAEARGANVQFNKKAPDVETGSEIVIRGLENMCYDLDYVQMT